MEIYIDVISNKYDVLKNFISSFSGKTLILSFIQENRKLEEEFGISDYIIFDNSDVLLNTINLEEAIIEIDENIDILPSSYRKKVDKFDYNLLSINIPQNYENIFILFDDKLIVQNKPKAIKYTENIKELNKEEQYIIVGNPIKVQNTLNIYGFTSDLNELKNNIISNKYIKNEKKSIIEIIKGLFKNG